MKVGIIGATGKAGKLILAEAVARGHEITAIVRNASKVEHDQVTIIEKELLALETADVKQFDVVVNSFNAPQGQEHLHVETVNHLISIFQSINTRLLMVGGAGSLFVDEAKTMRLMNSEGFSAAYYSIASNMGKGLAALEQSSINWTYLSPAAFFDVNGARTGKYEKGKDHVIVNRANQSYISYADYAIAVADEIEQNNHVKERFTVVGEKA
ncbi:NAD(P)-dependent oxidoreductase [Priestia megaterium]|nr:NAD(P)-dependent oxidoreductase [Priestia megaterium]